MDNTLAAIDLWEQGLDQLGTSATLQELKEHLDKAPEEAPSRDFLAGVIVGMTKEG